MGVLRWGEKRSFHFRKQLLWQIKSAQLLCVSSCQLSPAQFATRSVGHLVGCSPDMLSCGHCLRPRDKLLVTASLGWSVAKTWPKVSADAPYGFSDPYMSLSTWDILQCYDSKHWALLEEVSCMKLPCHPILFKGQSLSPAVLSFPSVFEWPLECDMRKWQGMGN